jgi:hypothetical protein
VNATNGPGSLGITPPAIRYGVVTRS